jgi:hypothetical protein
VWRIKYTDAAGKQIMETVGAEREGASPTSTPKPNYAADLQALWSNSTAAAGELDSGDQTPNLN